MDVRDLQRSCAKKRDVYHHAKIVHREAMRLGLSAFADMTALRSELKEALVAYYAAHSALHTALSRPAAGSARLH